MAENGPAAERPRDPRSSWDSECDFKARYSNLCGNDFLSDVTFLVGHEKRRVPGHRLILNLCSWDFFNVFNNLVLDNNELVVDDVPYESFIAFLRYCYTSKVDLEEGVVLNEALEILKLAQRFHVKSLVKICVDHIYSKLSLKNCMMAFRAKDIFPRDSAVPLWSWKEITMYFSSLIQEQQNLDIFMDLPLEAVKELVDYDKICCDEMQIFDVLMKWAKKNCEKSGIPPTGKHLRLILKDVFYEIRFPTMKASWFVEILAEYPEIFTRREISRICEKIHNNTLHCPGFKCASRILVDYMYVQPNVSFGRTVNLFSGVPKLDRGATYEMSAKFGAMKPLNLIGFAFITKKGEDVAIESCKFKSPGTGLQQIATTQSKRCQFNWDYDLIIIRLETKLKIDKSKNDDYGYQLQCRCDKMVPKIYSNDDWGEVHNNVQMMAMQDSVIPYLIVEF